MKHIARTLTSIALLIPFAWSLPSLAETATIPLDMPTSTPEIITSTPIIETPTNRPEIAPTPSSTLTIRFQNQIIWSGAVPLTSTIYHDQINNLDYQLTTPTVFSALVLADQQTDAFTISDAQYNQAFNSFYLACLNFPFATTTENACYNWNYAVHNSYPNIGMDAYQLAGNESVYIYFSNPWQITATTSTFPLNTTTTLQTWRYQFDNTLDPWVADGNTMIAISIPNPNPTGWWDQTIPVSTTQTNASGTVDYTFTATGTYTAQITSADFSKWSNPITLLVQDEALPNNTTPPVSGGGSGSNITTISDSDLNAAAHKILNFLKSKQAETGVIIDLSTSDWAAISFGSASIYAHDITAPSISLYDYLSTTIITSTTNSLNSCTEYSRHLLGLLAIGTAKTDTKIVDLKNNIRTQCLIGTLVGQPGINDDIFITLALLASDEPVTSDIVQTALATIKADQQPDGSFTWNGYPGQDVTGAAINALRYASSFGATIDSTIFDKAKNYLHTTQLADGGWTGFGTVSDALTTNWALYGVNALNEGQAQWTNAQGNNPWTVLTSQLNTQGYYASPWSTDGIDWFATKHAAPALLGKSWPIILNPASTPQTTNNSGNSQPAQLETSSTSTLVMGIISTTTTSTNTSAVTTTTTETTTPDITGEILGIKIEQPAIPMLATILAPTQHKPAIKKPELKIISTTPTAEPAQNTNTEPIAEPNDSPTVRDWIQNLLYISLAGIGLIGLFRGITYLKK